MLHLITVKNFFRERNIESITCYTEIDLEKTINRSFQLNDEEFFIKNNLEQYHHKYLNTN